MTQVSWCPYHAGVTGVAKDALPAVVKDADGYGCCSARVVTMAAIAVISVASGD